MSQFDEKPRPDYLSGAVLEGAPDRYRLLRRKSGEVVLQARVHWSGQTRDGFSMGGYEWRDLPTVDEE